MHEFEFLSLENILVSCCAVHVAVSFFLSECLSIHIYHMPSMDKIYGAGNALCTNIKCMIYSG